MDVTRVVAEVKVLPVYTCGECGRTEAGDTQSAVFDESSLEDLVEMLYRMNPRPAHMPVGWASYGVNEYKCDKCMT